MDGLTSYPSTASTSQEDHENISGSLFSRKLKVTLLSSEWTSRKGGLSTINRELAIQLAKHASVEVSVYLPQCGEEDKRVAASHNVDLIEAEKMPGYDRVDWLSFLPKNHAVDCVIGHGAILGRQVQGIKRHHHCKWIQVVHTAPEELGMYKEYDEHISRGEEKHQVEVELCKLADQVVAVGPKLAEAFSGYLRACGKDQDVLNLTPGIFSEFADVKQAAQELGSFSVLVFGRGDREDFQLKGYDIVAQAIAELKDMTYKLVFVGATSGEEEKVADVLLKQGINRSQLRVRRFNESREKLADLFCEVDLAIMPSRTEGFGLAALEALSAGLPVLVSGNSGFGEALKKVPFASSCVVQSEDPKDWANAIKAVRGKDRKLRLREAKILQGEYAEMYSWQDHCNRLVERMLAISQASNEDEQNFSRKAAVICQDEKPSPSEKRPHKGSTKKRQSSKKGKRPLSSSNIPAPKYPRLLEDDGTEKSVVVKLLRAEYERRSKLMPLSWFNTIQLPLENVYTRLKIVSRRKADFEVENVEVDMYDIFKDLKKGEDVMTLVEGSPGIGKTTFCLKLAYDWARETVPTNPSFPKLEYVLLLKCRDIDRKIMEAIKEQLLPEDMKEETWTKFSEFIKDIHNQEKILIILDGLDELPKKSQRFVDKLLLRRILPFCYILVTSRQEKGIDVRKNFEFDLLLEIKGFTEDDAYCYIKKHFQNVGPKHSSKGEKLTKEVKENTLLSALRNNPLNLLLLCVIYEDYDGKLPTSRTELYQVIVECLLRRYCAKNSLLVPEDNTLKKRFEEDILALGELAWTCLLNDRQSFREEQLVEREVRNKNLVARKIGLLYKEERLKRILRSQYEYWFLHKTFQEYLAAAFITHKLLRGGVKVFEFTTFDDLVQKYPQVFLFVSGMLGEKATVLFKQIGGELKERGVWGRAWDWNKCSEQESRFFVESFSETGHAEQMATSLCGVMPFPEEVFLSEDDDIGFPFAEVLIACKSFSNLQTPVQLEASFEWQRDVVIRCIESLSKLTSISLKSSYPPLNTREADHLRKWLSVSKSLLEFTFKNPCGDVNGDVPVLLCNGLASCKTLTKIKFSVRGDISEAYINGIETGLSPDTPLTSAVILEIYGSMRFSAIQALHKLLANKSLISLSLQIFGDVQDLLAGAVSEALAKQTVLKSINLRLVGKLSSASASSLKQGLLKNSSLNYIKVVVCGELPHNWQSVVETLCSTKKYPISCAFYPNTLDNIGHDDVGLVLAENRLIPKQHLTVNVWGKLSSEGADALCEVLIRSSLAFKLLTLNVHGNVTEDVANSVARCLKHCNILFLLSINVWGSLTPEGETILSELSKSNLCVHLNVHHVHLASEESNQVLDISIENPAALRAFFAKVKDTRKEKISLTISNISGEIREWTHHLADALAENTSLTSINLTVNGCLTDGLGECLLQSTSIKFLSLTINSSIKLGLLCKLGACFAKMAFLTTLSLEINDYSDERDSSIWNELKNVLLSIKSLSTLSVAVHGNNVDLFWNEVLNDYLQECTSLTNLSYSADRPFFGDGLAVTISLKTLNITLNVAFHLLHDSLTHLIEGLSLNGSLTTLTVTVSLTLMAALKVLSVGDITFKEGLSENRSITTFNLTVKEFGEGISDIDKILKALQVFEGLAQNTSITTFNLTLDSSRRVSDDWLPGLCDALNKNSSLTTLRLKLNYHRATGQSRLYDLSKLLLESRSISILELEVSFYGKENEAQKFLFSNRM